jgi:hypothetical protein
VGADWVPEAFEDNFAEVLEAESFANAQLRYRVRHQDLFRLRVGAEPGGQLNRRSEKIVMLLNRFAGCGADSNLERAVRLRFFMFGQFALNLNCASDRTRRRDE